MSIRWMQATHVFVFDSLIIDHIDRSQYFHQETKDYYIVNIVVSKKYLKNKPFSTIFSKPFL